MAFIAVVWFVAFMGLPAGLMWQNGFWYLAVLWVAAPLVALEVSHRRYRSSGPKEASDG